MPALSTWTASATTPRRANKMTARRKPPASTTTPTTRPTTSTHRSCTTRQVFLPLHPSLPRCRKYAPLSRRLRVPSTTASGIARVRWLAAPTCTSTAGTSSPSKRAGWQETGCVGCFEWVTMHCRRHAFVWSGKFCCMCFFSAWIWLIKCLKLV
ncbi:hypothetical protein IWX49DRAFT_601286 [Phyllosticta citricarpa]|uniref:Uncharacterized protein n=2 Tax=Phyllosticta TaxID=121621 RepID=A0ABR1M7Q4_9PEZI